MLALGLHASRRILCEQQRSGEALRQACRTGPCEVAALAASRIVRYGELRHVTTEARKESRRLHGSDLQWCSRQCRKLQRSPVEHGLQGCQDFEVESCDRRFSPASLFALVGGPSARVKNSIFDKLTPIVKE